MKKLLSVALCLVLIFSALPVFAISASGSETTAEYKKIYTASDLDAVRLNMSGNYILMNDIDLSNTEGFKEWIPIGCDNYYGATEEFSGCFDGNGFTIYGLSADISNTGYKNWYKYTYNYVGLFYKITGTVCNLNLKDVYISCSDNHTDIYWYCSGIATLNYGNIYNCSVSGRITNSYNERCSGFVYENYGNIDSCANFADVKGYGAGIAYKNYGDGIISNCYNAGNITNGWESGSCAGITFVNYGTVESCYNVGQVGSSYPISRSASEGKYVMNTYHLNGPNLITSVSIGLSESDMKNQSSFSGFDFDNVWTMGGNPDYEYPELQCFALSGKLCIKGDVGYLSTVESDLSGINRVDDTFTYEWLIDGNVVGTSNTYSIEKSDIGKKIQLKVTGTKEFNSGTLYSEEITVSKAKQTVTPTVSELLSLNDNSFEISTKQNQEYSLDNINWQVSGEFNNLLPNKQYTVYSRIIENDLYRPGDSMPVLTITTDRRPLSGVVAITGTSRYGDTLTADIAGVLPSNATYVFEWKRNGVVVGNGTTYTLGKEDIGNSITLSVVGSGDFIGTITSASVMVTKTTVQLPNAPVVSDKTNTSVTLISKTGYEYSKDKTTWQTSPVFTGLSAATEYTFYQRIKETDTTFASKTSTGTKVVTLKNSISAPAKPTIKTITNTSVTLVHIDGYEYSLDGLTWQTNNVFTDLSPNTEYAFCQRKAENATDYASAQSGYTLAITLKNTITAPAAPTVKSATASSVTLNQIDGYEYSLDGSTWQKSNVFNGLNVLETYTFYQRIAETSTDYASATSEGTSFKVKNVVTAPATPTLTEKTNNKIVVAVKTGCEYSINKTTWNTTGVFTGLQPNQTYTVYCRIPETETHYASTVSDALTVTTLKNTVSAPSAPVLSSKTDSSVTLVANSTYEYSKNGTTWQASNVFSGLSPNTEYTFYQRKAETNTAYASEKSAALKVLTSKQSVAAPSAPVLSNKTTTSVTLVKTSGYEYSKDGNTWQSSNVFDGLKPNTQYSFYQRKAETDTTCASEKSAALTVTTLKKDAGATNPVVVARVTATSVTLAPCTGYEYSKDGTTWQISNVFTGLTANTAYKFYQRIAETADTNASATSPVCNVTTSAKSACSISPAAPIVAETTTSKVVLVAREGYEYSKNGTTWQTSNTFSGLSSNTSYTFYQRIAETGSELASDKSTGVTVKTYSSSSVTTAATNYDRLRSYISLYGSADSNGNKSIVRTSTTSSGMTIYYSLTNVSNGIEFALLTSQSTATKLVGQTEFVLTRSSTTISVYSSMLYYYAGSLTDSVGGTKNINRSTYSDSNTYSFYLSGSMITGSDFSDNFNTTLKLLCTYWNNYIYNNLGFSLKGLGFTSFPGAGSAACDPLTSYHTGNTETRNACGATCTTDGYTGDTYCATCGEKVSSGSVIACIGHHTYTDSCDKTCNTCGEERVIEHQYSNVCDTSCNICNTTRAEIEHIFDNECDETCNECFATRKAPHVFYNECDEICSECGAVRKAPHIYSNACDTNCNDCGNVRTVGEHIYTNDCDTDCNECGNIRTVGEHIYDNDCDTDCNECGDVRAVPDHIYDSSTDTDCNECGFTRQAGLASIGGVWYYTVDGNIDYTYTGLCYYAGADYYIVNGTINWYHDGLIYYEGDWYYVRGGAVASDYSGLVYYNDIWYYVQNGRLDWDLKTLIYYANDWFYVESGVINWSYTGFCEYYGTPYYVQYGRVNWTHDGLVYVGGNWYYVRGGAKAVDYSGLVYYNDIWYYVQNGALDWDLKTLIYYANDWFYVESGVINWSYTGFCNYYGTEYYVQYGRVNWTHDGLVYVDGEWYYARGGAKASDYCGLVYYNNTWYYVENGWLDWNLKTLVYYANDWFYVESGVINWDYSGPFTHNGKTYTIQYGRVI